MPTTESVTDLAHRLLSTEDAPKISEAHRLAAFIVDHHAHLDFDTPARAAEAATSDKPTSELLQRLTPLAPGVVQGEEG